MTHRAVLGLTTGLRGVCQRTTSAHTQETSERHPSLRDLRCHTNSKPSCRNLWWWERRGRARILKELEQVLESCDKASSIWALMEEVRYHVERTKGPIQEGSDLARWIDWALDHADRIDPLQRKSRENIEPDAATKEALPRKPR